MASPAARFLQWKATLTADADGRSPELESVDVAYLPKNVAPRVEQIEITPANYNFPAPLTLRRGRLAAAIADPAAARHKRAAPAPALILESPHHQHARHAVGQGLIGARWVASDPNGDSMIYTVEIRGVKETEWKPLKDKLTEKYFSWDSTRLPGRRIPHPRHRFRRA